MTNNNEKGCKQRRACSLFYVIDVLILLLELVVNTELNVCSVEVNTESLNLSSTLVLLLVTEETNLCDESHVVREVNLQTRLDAELESIIISAVATEVLVTYSTLKEEVNELCVAECIACVRSELECVVAVLYTLVTDGKTSLPVLVELITNLRNECVMHL